MERPLAGGLLQEAQYGPRAADRHDHLVGMDVLLGLGLDVVGGALCRETLTKIRKGH